MIGQVIQCENKGCDIKFTKKTHNQRYHDDECCRLATNAKIMEKYYVKRAQKLGLERHCESCEVKLSRYNPQQICNPCQAKSVTSRNSSVANMLSNMSFVI